MRNQAWRAGLALLGAWGLSFAGAAPRAAATTPHYSLTDLGGGVAYGISSKGQVVGSSQGNQNGVAFLWTPATVNGTTGTRQSLGALPTGSGISSAYGVNDYGQITGYSTSTDAASGIRAFLWTPTVANGTTGSMVPIGGTAWWGTAINSYGQIGVNNATVTAANSGRLWTPSTTHGTSGSLTTFSGGASFFDVVGINSSGQLVGSGADGTGAAGAMIFKPSSANSSSGTCVAIGNLGNSSVFSSAGYAINEKGQVAGFSQGGTLGDGAFLWTPTIPNGTSGSMSELPYHQGASNHYLHATGINDSTFIVGWDTTDISGLLWTPDNGLLELDTLVDSTGTNWLLSQPFAINNTGQIVGLGAYDADGAGPGAATSHAFLLTPVPEPGSAATALVGGIATCMVRQRRRRRRRRSVQPARPRPHASALQQAT